MIEETYLKEFDKENELCIISFEGDKEDIYELRDFAKLINSVKDEVRSKYYRGFSKNISKHNNCEHNYGKADYEMVVNPAVEIDIDEILNSMKKAPIVCHDDKDVCDIDAEEDLVNHPHHYAENGAMECIDEMILLYGEEAVMNFCLCNMHKYRYRANMKGGAVDKQKSDWYVAKYKELKDIVQKRKCDRYRTFMNDMRTLVGTGASLHIEESEFVNLYKKYVPCDVI